MILSRRPKDDDSKDGFTNWPFMTTHTWGEHPMGTWRLIVRFQVGMGIVEIVRWLEIEWYREVDIVRLKHIKVRKRKLKLHPNRMKEIEGGYEEFRQLVSIVKLKCDESYFPARVPIKVTIPEIDVSQCYADLSLSPFGVRKFPLFSISSMLICRIRESFSSLENLAEVAQICKKAVAWV